MHLSPTRLRILATAADGSEFECFTWTRNAQSGIDRAQADAERFGRSDLRDFRAVPA